MADARKIVRDFGHRSDCDMSLVDMEWLTREIAQALAAAEARGMERAAVIVEWRAGADTYADDNRPCGPCCTLNAAAIRAAAVGKP